MTVQVEGVQIVELGQSFKMGDTGYDINTRHCNTRQNFKIRDCRELY